MGAAKRNILGSDYVGAFATATDKHLFIGTGLGSSNTAILSKTLAVEPVELSVFGTGLVGLFCRANSNGIILCNMAEQYEIDALKAKLNGMNVVVIESGLNVLGNNIIANDRIAIVNPDYGPASMKQIQDALGVETVKLEIGGFKAIGANNILTNKGLVVNNRASDEEKEDIDRLVGFESISSTANTGSLNIGLSAVANSNGMVVGEDTTGFELARIMDALNLD